MNKVLGIGVFFLAVLIVFAGLNKFGEDYIQHELINIEQLVEIEPVPAMDTYGFIEDRYDFIEEEVKRNESLYIILSRHGLSPRDIYNVQQKADGVVNLNRMRPGQNYRIYFDENEEPRSFVWQRSGLEYTTIHLKDEVEIEQGKVPIEVRERETAGVVQNSLYQTVLNEGGTRSLANKMAEIYAWEIDFFRLQSGDHYKVIYEDLYAGDTYLGVGDVKAAEFQHRGETYRAYFFENGERIGYFDEEGKSLQRELLRAPFRYSQRVSSGFSQNRFHPVLKTNRPHHGTDYAAPTGTPVLAVGDGVVTEAQRRGNNGNIVQIRHNNTYRTAYLHLNGFAEGIRRGAEVEQGQVIGYVGQTGMATGPHLCYRLYVNDRPVNSVRADLPEGEPLEEEYHEEFMYYVNQLDEQLNNIELRQEVAAK